MRATRRNISITSEVVDKALDNAENISKFVEKAILYYLEETEKEYATVEDLDELRGEFKIINQNYKQVESILADMAKVIFK